MKVLYLVRHAKSSWEDASLDDIDRPLKTSGVNDAYMMSDFLKEKKVAPELIITSPAVRAISTALIFTNKLKIPTEQIKILREIYESSPGDILNKVRMTNPIVNSLMVFGHDPSLTSLFTLLTGKSLEKIPTSAVASIFLSIDEWQKIVPAAGTLQFLHRPKEIRSMMR